MSSILSVTQLNKYVQFKIQSDLKLQGIAVRGELSNFNVNYKSGHAYFTLKDEDCAVKCVMFSSSVKKLKFAPENGMSVLVTGNLDVYERDGVYQIKASDIQPLGAGALHTSIEQLKTKLGKIGVFEQSSKKLIPVLPKKIAVVTSLTGAVLQDVKNVLSRRFPIGIVEVYPTQVQGSEAVNSISLGLSAADKSDCDVIILARGGGSLEDLMPFNSEKVAMTIYSCQKPIISAVGHETDTTLADYAADLRAPTPSAAAELAVPDISELISACGLMTKKIDNAINKFIDSKFNRINEIDLKFKLNSPDRILDENILKLKQYDNRLTNSISSRISKESAQLDKFAVQLTALSPFNVLDRGYSITTKDSKVVYSAKQVNSGDKIEIRFSDSKCTATVN